MAIRRYRYADFVHAKWRRTCNGQPGFKQPVMSAAFVSLCAPNRLTTQYAGPALPVDLLAFEHGDTDD